MSRYGEAIRHHRLDRAYRVRRFPEPITADHLYDLFCEDEDLVVAFSMGGVHGTKTTIEEARALLQECDEDGRYMDAGEVCENLVTFVLLNPRAVLTIYGKVRVASLRDADTLDNIRYVSQNTFEVFGA